jgi:hypothetical protein
MGDFVVFASFSLDSSSNIYLRFQYRNQLHWCNLLLSIDPIYSSHIIWIFRFKCTKMSKFNLMNQNKLQ